MFEVRAPSPHFGETRPPIDLRLSIFNATALAAFCVLMLMLALYIFRLDLRHAAECYAALTAIQLGWMAVQATVFTPKK